MYQNFIIPYLYEAQHVSGDTPSIIRILKLHWQPLVFYTWKVVWTRIWWTLSATVGLTPSTYEIPEAASVVLGSWWWAVWYPKHVPYKYGIIKFWSLMQLVGFYLWTKPGISRLLSVLSPRQPTHGVQAASRLLSPHCPPITINTQVLKPISSAHTVWLHSTQNQLNPKAFCEHLVTSHLTLRRLMSYIYGAPILDVSRSHTTTQHSR